MTLHEIKSPTHVGGTNKISRYGDIELEDLDYAELPINEYAIKLPARLNNKHIAILKKHNVLINLSDYNNATAGFKKNVTQDLIQNIPYTQTKHYCPSRFRGKIWDELYGDKPITVTRARRILSENNVRDITLKKLVQDGRFYHELNAFSGSSSLNFIRLCKLSALFYTDTCHVYDYSFKTIDRVLIARMINNSERLIINDRRLFKIIINVAVRRCSLLKVDWIINSNNICREDMINIKKAGYYAKIKRVNDYAKNAKGL